MDTEPNNLKLPTPEQVLGGLEYKVSYRPGMNDKNAPPPGLAAMMVFSPTGGDYMVAKELLERNSGSVPPEYLPHVTKAVALLKLAGFDEQAKELTGMVADTVQGKQVAPEQQGQSGSWKSTVGRFGGERQP